jgi:hypothetical protein
MAVRRTSGRQKRQAGVRPDLRVARHQGQAFDPRLGHQQPVEGISMQWWQQRGGLGMFEGDWEALDPEPRHRSRSRFGDLQPGFCLIAISQTDAALRKTSLAPLRMA